MKLSKQAKQFIEKQFTTTYWDCTMRDGSNGCLFHDGKGRPTAWSIELIEDLVKVRGSKITKGSAFFTPLMKGQPKVKLYTRKN
mgnify:CR=1 FL=1